MRPFLALLLLLGSLPALPGLGRLVLPDGTAVPLGTQEGPGTVTFLFPSQAVPPGSWLVLPSGSAVDEAVFEGRGTRTVLTVPRVKAPRVRFAFQTGSPIFALTLRGHLPPDPVLRLAVRRPDTDDAAWVTRSSASLRIGLPAWKAAAGYTPYLRLTRPPGPAVKAAFSAGEQTRSFSLPAGLGRWDFAPSAWGFTPTRIELSGPDLRMTAVEVQAAGPEADLPADPDTLLAWPRDAWRDGRREWFAWSGTSVLVLVTDTYRTQDAYLKRLAFYVEKTGFRGRLVTDEEVAALHAWNAHDYSAPDLARFFTQASRENFPLNPSETELRERLTAAGILKPAGAGAWEPGTGALVGISQESGPELRAVLFVHEGFHGLYFTTPAFRDGVRTVWDGLSDGARQAFRTYLAASRYDPGDEGLMVNEFQAYVLQRSAADWGTFFRTRVLAHAGSAGESLVWLTEYLAAAQTLDALVQGLFGLKSGVVSPVTRL